MNSKCPVCATENDTDAPRQCGAVEFYSCQRCGPFFLEFRSSDLSHLLMKEKKETRFPGELTNDVEKMAALSHWIRTWYESRRREPVLDWELVKSIIETPRPPLVEQANNFVRWIGDSTKIGGKYVDIDRHAIQAIVGSTDWEEFLFVSQHLEEDGFIKTHASSHDDRRIWCLVSLSFSGWEQYQELKRSTTESHKAFMAMKYDDEQLDRLFENVLRPAVKQTGFDLFRLIDRPKAGLIDNRLRVEIQTSRFLIADLTHENAGAYWEAGYAEGLGKPVIYTCEKNKFETCKTHFDTNHHLTVKWDSNGSTEMVEELKATIRATLPAEAKLTDD